MKPAFLRPRLLKTLLKPDDKLVVLPGARHNGMTDSPDYWREMARLLVRQPAEIAPRRSSGSKGCA